MATHFGHRGIAQITIVQNVNCRATGQWPSADTAESTIRRGAMPGVTRSGVSLTREPGQLLHNMRAYALGLRGKMQLKRESRGSHGLSVLTEAARRLTAVDFVAFATGFRDVMQKVVAPWVATSQDSSMEPWVTLAPRRQLFFHRITMEKTCGSEGAEPF